MEHGLATYLHQMRGQDSLVAFSRKLGLSYTFVREMERGNRLPSDDVIVRIGERLAVDPTDLALLTYRDRSSLLAQALSRRGVDSPQPPPTALPVTASNGGMARAVVKV